MYAVKLFRVFCNRGLFKIPPLVSANNNFVTIINNCRFKLNLKSANLPNVLFSTNSSPDDNHNVSKGKLQKKRRRVISSSSSDDSESPKKTVDDVK